MSSNNFLSLEIPSAQTVLTLQWNAYGMLSKIDWSASTQQEAPTFPDNLATWAPAPILELASRLRHYFRTGEPLGTLPWEWLDQSAWTPFQYKVFAAIARIPHGETRTYGWVAQRIGSPSAMRAVGQSLKSNPLPIFVPCHRVVAADSIGGFMGTSDPSQPQLSLKRCLLELEQTYLNPCFSFITGAAAV